MDSAKPDKGLNIPLILKGITDRLIDPKNLSRAAKCAIAQYLISDGYSNYFVCDVLKAPYTTVRFWVRDADEAIGREVRSHVDAVIGRFMQTATRMKERARSRRTADNKPDPDYNAIWGIECDLVDRLIRMGVVVSDSERPVDTLEAAFERYSGERIVDAEFGPGQTVQPAPALGPPTDESGPADKPEGSKDVPAGTAGPNGQGNGHAPEIPDGAGPDSVA